VTAGGQVTASMTLDAAAPPGAIQVELAWVLPSVFNAISSGGAFTNSDINLITVFTVAAGATTASTNFAAPALSPQPIVVFAVTNTGGTPANATLTIV